MRRYGWVLWAVALGCGSDDGANGGSSAARAAASQTLIGEHCTAWKSWFDRCGQPGDGDDFYQECLGDRRWGLTWASVLQTYVTCFEQLPCEASDDQCTSEVFESLGISANDALHTRCLARADQCPDVLDDNCAGVLVYNDDARAAIDACIDTDCASFGLCLLDPLGMGD